jgi:hypothetical protein
VAGALCMQHSKKQSLGEIQKKLSINLLGSFNGFQKFDHSKFSCLVNQDLPMYLSFSHLKLLPVSSALPGLYLPNDYDLPLQSSPPFSTTIWAK